MKQQHDKELKDGGILISKAADRSEDIPGWLHLPCGPQLDVLVSLRHVSVRSSAFAVSAKKDILVNWSSWLDKLSKLLPSKPSFLILK